MKNGKTPFMITKKEYSTSISISAFPHDDKEYFIKNFGLIRKNPSVDSSQYLAEVFTEEIDTGKEKTIEIIWTHLLAVRIGSVWKNRKLVHEYSYKKQHDFEEKIMSLSLNGKTLPSIKLLVRSKKTGKKRMVVAHELNLDKDEVLSAFTVFVTEDGMQVMIPSLEILLSSYDLRPT